MSGVNKVILVGRLGKDPEVRNLDNGAVVANFSIATSESYKDRTTGEKKEVTLCCGVVLLRSHKNIFAKVIWFLSKVNFVHVHGRKMVLHAIQLKL